MSNHDRHPPSSEEPIKEYGTLYYPEQRYNRTIMLALLFGLLVGCIVGAALMVIL